MYLKLGTFFAILTNSGWIDEKSIGMASSSIELIGDSGPLTTCGHYIDPLLLHRNYESAILDRDFVLNRLYRNLWVS